MEFTFSGRITFDDYVQFNRFILRKRIVLRLIVYIFSLILLIFTFGLSNLKDGFSFDSLNIALCFMFFFLIYATISLLFSKRRYRKIFNSSKTIEEECHYIINEKYMKTSSETTNSTLTQETIHKIIFDKDSMYIFLAMNMAQIIKKRFLGNDEYEKLTTFVKENYKDKISKK